MVIKRLTLFVILGLVATSSVYAKKPTPLNPIVTVSGSIANQTSQTLYFVGADQFNGTWSVRPAQTLAAGHQTNYTATKVMQGNSDYFSVNLYYSAQPNTTSVSNCWISSLFQFENGFYSGAPSCTGFTGYEGTCDKNGSLNSNNSYHCNYEIRPSN